MDLDLIKKIDRPFYLAGIDEVGRGPLAGPVVCASAILKIESFNSEVEDYLQFLSELGVTDSKKLTPKKRQKILDQLGVDVDNLKPNESFLLFEGNNFSVHYSLSEVSHTLIDEMNILRASLFGMEEAFLQMTPQGEGVVLIDGNKVPERLEVFNAQAVVKGDSKSIVIALASIIAKEYRDFLMKKLGAQYPGYGLEKHAGYPTKDHKQALIDLGVTPIHRKTFKGVKELIH